MIKAKEMPVLMVCFSFPPHYSGAVMQAIALGKQLQRHGLDCQFLAPAKDSNCGTTNGEVEGVTVHKFRGGDLSFALQAAYFLVMHRNRYQAVHFHGFSRWHFICVVAAKLAGHFVVQKMTKGGISDSEINPTGVLGPIRIVALRWIDCFIAISSDLGQALLSHGIPAARIREIPNGVDVSAFRPVSADEKASVRAVFGLPKNMFIMVCASAIQRRKNNLDIARAYALAMTLRPELKRSTRLVFAGPFHTPEYALALKRFVQESDLTDNVVFTGQLEREKLSKLYMAADLCVFGGSNEGLPNAVLEAKSSGLPVVAFETYGVRDVVRHGEDGVLVTFGDIFSYADAMLQIINNQELRQRFGANGRRDCEARFELGRIASRYLSEVYDIAR